MSIFQDDTKPVPMLDPQSVRVDEDLQTIGYRKSVLRADSRSLAMSVVNILPKTSRN